MSVLQQNIQQHIKTRKPQRNYPVKSIICRGVCWKRTSRKTYLALKAQLMSLVQQLFQSNFQLQNPKWNHIGITPAQCLQCEKCFMSRVTLGNHMILTHNGITQGQCLQCEKYFMSRVALGNHMILTHKGITQGQCLRCENYYMLRGALGIHMT